MAFHGLELEAWMSSLLMVATVAMATHPAEVYLEVMRLAQPDTALIPKTRTSIASHLRMQGLLMAAV